MEKHVEELALLEVLDCGKPISDARNGDVPEAIETLRWHAEMTDKLYDQLVPTGQDNVSMIVREPIGVVGGILPWNYPIFCGMWKLAPALAGGNSVVLKPAELTPLTTILMAKLAAEAGVPDGVVNVVPGMGATAGEALGLHMDVDCVSFTGSGSVGRKILQYSAQSNLKKAVLELGGKSPAIVMDDAADLEYVADQVATGFLFCQGENCSAGSRLIVHEKIKDHFLDMVIKAANDWVVGDPLDPETNMGALIEEKHFHRVMGYIAKGENGGAKKILGGNQILAETGGFYVEPTIFDDVNSDMTIAREEIFGPVLSVLSFKDADEAISIANNTSYGLASSLYTQDLTTAHKMSRALRAGTVSVNCFSEGDFASPFGGFKQSGFGGRDKGIAAHEQYLETKSIWMQLR